MIAIYRSKIHGHDAGNIKRRIGGGEDERRRRRRWRSDGGTTTGVDPGHGGDGGEEGPARRTEQRLGGATSVVRMRVAALPHWHGEEVRTPTLLRCCCCCYVCGPSHRRSHPHRSLDFEVSEATGAWPSIFGGRPAGPDDAIQTVGVGKNSIHAESSSPCMVSVVVISLDAAASHPCCVLCCAKERKKNKRYVDVDLGTVGAKKHASKEAHLIEIVIVSCRLRFPS